MKAIILASGLGSRFKHKTKQLPKSLLTIGKKTILERLLLSLSEGGVKDIIITTGYLDEKIKDFVKNNKGFKDLQVSYIHNPKYALTNYIYSFWLTRKLIDKHDVILLHGDLIYDFSLLKRIILQKKSSIVVNKIAEVPKKDFKAIIKNKKIRQIGVDIFAKDAVLCMPMYKLLKKDHVRWMKQIDKFIKQKKVTCYAEDALNEVLDTLNLFPVYFVEERCMEVDNDKDLTLAKKLFSS